MLQQAGGPSENSLVNSTRNARRGVDKSDRAIAKVRGDIEEKEKEIDHLRGENISLKAKEQRYVARKDAFTRQAEFLASQQLAEALTDSNREVLRVGLAYAASLGDERLRGLVDMLAPMVAPSTEQSEFDMSADDSSDSDDPGGGGSDSDDATVLDENGLIPVCGEAAIELEHLVHTREMVLLAMQKAVDNAEAAIVRRRKRALGGDEAKDEDTHGDVEMVELLPPEKVKASFAGQLEDLEIRIRRCQDAAGGVVPALYTPTYALVQQPQSQQQQRQRGDGGDGPAMAPEAGGGAEAMDGDDRHDGDEDDQQRRKPRRIDGSNSMERATGFGESAAAAAGAGEGMAAEAEGVVVPVQEKQREIERACEDLAAKSATLQHAVRANEQIIEQDRLQRQLESEGTSVEPPEVPPPVLVTIAGEVDDKDDAMDGGFSVTSGAAEAAVQACTTGDDDTGRAASGADPGDVPPPAASSVPRPSRAGMAPRLRCRWERHAATPALSEQEAARRHGPY